MGKNAHAHTVLGSVKFYKNLFFNLSWWKKKILYELWITKKKKETMGRGKATRIMMVRNYFYCFVDSLAATNGILDEIQWVSSSINDFLMGVIIIIILLCAFFFSSSSQQTTKIQQNNSYNMEQTNEIWGELKREQSFSSFFICRWYACMCVCVFNFIIIRTRFSIRISDLSNTLHTL